MKPESYYLIHRTLLIGPIFSLLNPLHRLQSDFVKVHFNIIHPSIPRTSKRSLPFKVPKSQCTSQFHIRATSFIHHVISFILNCNIWIQKNNFKNNFTLATFWHYTWHPDTDMIVLWEKFYNSKRTGRFKCYIESRWETRGLMPEWY
jgi:hypothetical protein